LDKVSAPVQTRIVQVESFQPSPRLRPHVQAIRVIVSEAGELTAPLPEPGLVMAVRYAGRAETIDNGVGHQIPDASVSGIRASMRRISTTVDGGLVVAIFHAAGAARFFSGPLHELFGATVDLGDLTSRSDAERLQARLADASSHASRAAVVDEFLLSHLIEGSGDPLVDAAVQAIHGAHGTLTVESLRRRLGLSIDRLEKRFRRRVGASPKQLASIVRFRYGLRAYRPDRPLTQLAHDAGYFDQSHLIRDFRAVTGLTPRDFLRSPDYWG
jgi:AraC-like DNA-binding protein